MRLTDIDFYIHQRSTDAEVLRTACLIVNKAWAQGLVVHVLTRDDAQSQHIDELLWTFEQGSFIPHECWSPESVTTQGLSQGSATVLIASDPGAQSKADLLVNLGNEPPSWFTDCARVAELVGADDVSKSAGRARYRHYREQLGEQVVAVVDGNDESHAKVSDNKEGAVALRTHKV